MRRRVGTFLLLFIFYIGPISASSPERNVWKDIINWAQLFYPKNPAIECISYFLKEYPPIEHQLTKQDLLKFSQQVNSFGQAEDYFGLSTQKMQELLEAPNQSYFINLMQSGYVQPWTNSLYPSEKIRALTFHFHPLFRTRGINNSTKLLNYLEQKTDSASILSSTHLLQESIQSYIDRPRFSDKLMIDGKTFLTRAMLCGDYTKIYTEACMKALKRILEIMAPIEIKGKYSDASSVFLSMLPLYEQIFSDPIYHEGIRVAAIRIYDLIQNPSLMRPDENIFSLLTDSFKTVNPTATDDDAIERAWNVLGLYATRGPNLGDTLDLLLPGPMNKVAVSAAALISGMMILDSRTFPYGRPFSYPRNIYTQIDSGKPYHFWLSAYLARKMALEYGSSYGAVYAVWITQIGYQMRSTTDGRDPVRAFMINPFDHRNNKIRLDLAIASAGAVHGGFSFIGENKAVQLNINDVLFELLNKSENLPPLNQADAESLWTQLGGGNGYLRWSKIFRPKTAINGHLKNVH